MRDLELSLGFLGLLKEIIVEGWSPYQCWYCSELHCTLVESLWTHSSPGTLTSQMSKGSYKNISLQELSK